VAEEDRPGGRERILAAALQMLETQGEAALRFTEIGERAGVAISVITHHFATREGLMAALHAHRFSGLVAGDQQALRSLSDTAADRAQFAAGIAAVTATVVDAARAHTRLTRVVSIGATHGRPELAAQIRRIATGLLDDLTTVVVTGQANGLLDATVDARALATFVQAYALGMVVADLDESPPSRAELAAVIDRAIDAFLTEPTV